MNMGDWLNMPLPWYELLLRLATPLVCGAVVGFEREYRGHTAGLRTHMLIALGSATFALIGVSLYQIQDEENPQQFAGDPLRTVSAVAGGIGFLGAGAIIQQRGRARGLTTAAGIWTVAAIGVASGVGFYVLAICVTLLAFITLAVLRRIEVPLATGRRADDAGGS